MVYERPGRGHSSPGYSYSGRNYHREKTPEEKEQERIKEQQREQQRQLEQAALQSTLEMPDSASNLVTDKTVKQQKVWQGFLQVVSQKHGTKVARIVANTASEGKVSISDLVNKEVPKDVAVEIYQDWDLLWSESANNVSQSDEAQINQVFQAGIPTAIVGTYGTTLGTKIIWRTFGAVIASKYGAVAAQTLGLSAADGLLPVGEAVAAGLLAVTAWQIYRNWDELWAEAEQILVGQEPEPQIYVTPTGEQVETPKHTGHSPEKVETGTPGFDTESAPRTPRHTGHEVEKPVADDFVMESVSLPYPKLAPGDTELGDKLRSLNFKPNDIKRIYNSLEKTGGGQAVADWIKSGQFDDIDGYDELVKFAKNSKELASVYQSLEAGEILTREGNRIVFEQKSEVGKPPFDIDLAIVGTDGNYIKAIQLKYLESLNNFAKQTNKAVGQLVNSPSQEKVVEIKIDRGTYEEFVDSGKEGTFIRTTVKDNPDIKIKIEFSDGVNKIY